jgi:hypothetical protein
VYGFPFFVCDSLLDHNEADIDSELNGNQVARAKACVAVVKGAVAKAESLERL